MQKQFSFNISKAKLILFAFFCETVITSKYILKIKNVSYLVAFRPIRKDKKTFEVKFTQELQCKIFIFKATLYR